MNETHFLTLFSKGSYAQIIANYKKENFSCDTDPIISKIYAASLFSLGSYTECYDVLELLESALSNSVDYLSLFGATCRRLGLLDKAEIFLKKAVEMNPSDAASNNNFANLLIDQNKLDAAESILVAILKDNPSYADARANLNRLQFKRSSFIDENSLSTDSSFTEGLVKSGIFDENKFNPLMLAFDTEEVEKYGRLKRSHSDNSSSKITKMLPKSNIQELASEQLRLAAQALRESNFIFTLELCTKVLHLIGPNEAVYDCAADAYISLSRFMQAEICILHALAISDSPNIKHYINLTSLVSMRGDFNLALSYLDMAASIDPSHEKLSQIRDNINASKLKDRAYSFSQAWKDKNLQRLK